MIKNCKQHCCSVLSVFTNCSLIFEDYQLEMKITLLLKSASNKLFGIRSFQYSISNRHAPALAHFPSNLRQPLCLFEKNSLLIHTHTHSQILAAPALDMREVPGYITCPVHLSRTLSRILSRSLSQSSEFPRNLPSPKPGKPGVPVPYTTWLCYKYLISGHPVYAANNCIQDFMAILKISATMMSW